MNASQLQVAPTSVATSPTAIQIATLVVAGIAAVGAVIAAIVISISTSRREKNAWRRQQQTAANEKYYSAAAELVHYVASGEPDSAAKHPTFVGLEESIDRIPALTSELQKALTPIQVVAEQETIAAATEAMVVLPILAHLAIPLIGTANHAGWQQRGEAIRQMASITDWVATTMRRDLGIKVAADEKAAERAEKKDWRTLLVAPVDRRDALDPPSELQRWRVRNGRTGELPTAFDGYAVPMIYVVVDNTHRAQAVLTTSHGEFWHFQIFAFLHPAVSEAITRDAARLVAGHAHAYDAKLVVSWSTGGVPSERVWVFHSVDSDAVTNL